MQVTRARQRALAVTRPALAYTDQGIVPP